MANVNPVGGAGTDEGRDSWCTPKWLADLIGKVDIDVASNRRALIQAAVSLIFDEGDNGLAEAGGVRCYSQRNKPDGTPWGIDRSAIVREDTKVFCNPPYARGAVIRWVKHWRSTRFIFLLRWDPSTEWFAELIGHCTHVWFPGRRINFEPPPGVKGSSNPFPHALYLRNPDDALQARLSNTGYLFPVDQALLDFFLSWDEVEDDESGEDDRDSDAGEEVEGGVGKGGVDAGKTPLGIQQWIPAPDPKFQKFDLSKIKKYSDPLDQRWWVGDYKRFGQEKGKATEGCGECQDCKYGLTCVFKTKQGYKQYIAKLQGW